jgi:hypothetical protein
VSGNPLIRTVSDTTGTLTTTVDLLGREVSRVDVWGKSTLTTYDQVGRITHVAGSAGLMESVYSASTGRLASEKLDDETIALLTYDAAGELSAVEYPSGSGNAGNGTSLAAITRDHSGATTALVWEQASGALLTSDVLTTSQSGRVIDRAVDGTDVHAGANFTYDAAGRLTVAKVAGRSATYAYASSGAAASSLGPDATAGSPHVPSMAARPSPTATTLRTD